MKDPNLSGTVCPECNRQLDDAMETSGCDVRPSPGDLTVCAYCAALLEYNDDYSLKTFTKERFNKLDKRDRIMLVKAQKVINGYNNKKKGMH